MSLSNKDIQSFENITCPFCSLHCDDLSIDNHAGNLKVAKNACLKAKSLIEKKVEPLHPLIDGKQATLEQAIKQAATILKKSKQPLITGLGTDVGGMRNVMRLADKIGSVLDHMHSEGTIRNTKVLQDQGWVMTTMAEIKNRADLVIMAGTDGTTNYPRFFERVIHNKHGMFTSRNKSKEIIYLGEKKAFKISSLVKNTKPTFINFPNEQLGEVIGVLHSMIAGNGIDNNKLTRVKLGPLEKLSERIKQARYGVIVWAPGELNFSHAELTIQSIAELIKYLNRSTRFTGFSLGGNDGGVTATNVCTWRSGYPMRVNFGNGFPEYDPHKYSANNVLLRKETDALVWISSFDATRSIHRAKIPTIILSSTPVAYLRKPHVFIPVGTPGIDCTGQIFRTDSVVALPFKKIREINRATVGYVINEIYKLL